MVGHTGFEPVTSGSGDQRSIQTELMPPAQIHLTVPLFMPVSSPALLPFVRRNLPPFSFSSTGQQNTSSCDCRYVSTLAPSDLLHTGSKFPGGLENRHRPFRDLHDLARLGISSGPGSPGDHLEGPKASNLDAFPPLQCRTHREKESFDHSGRIGLGQSDCLCNLIHNVGFGHLKPFLNSYDMPENRLSVNYENRVRLSIEIALDRLRVESPHIRHFPCIPEQSPYIFCKL